MNDELWWQLLTLDRPNAVVVVHPHDEQAVRSALAQMFAAGGPEVQVSELAKPGQAHVIPEPARPT